MPPKPFTAKVADRRDLTPTVFEIDFLCDPAFEFKSGQFASIIVPGGSAGGKDIRRAYSIASGPKDSVVQLCVKLVEGGPGTNYLKKLNVGDSIKGLAPYGDFVCKSTASRNAVFISTGTGIAPFRSMLRDREFWAGRTGRAINLFGARDADEILYAEEFSKIPGVESFVCLSRPSSNAAPGWSGFKGRVTDFIRSGGLELSSVEIMENTDFYLCGSNQMIDEIKQILTGLGTPKTAIHQEIYYKVKSES